MGVRGSEQCMVSGMLWEVVSGKSASGSALGGMQQKVFFFFFPVHKDFLIYEINSSLMSQISVLRYVGHIYIP